MDSTIRIVLICLALTGCATPGNLASVSTIGGAGEADKGAAPERAREAGAAQAGSGSGGGGIWSNFSSAFGSGATPVSQRPGENIAIQPLDANEALRLINEYRSSKRLPPLALDSQASAAAQALAKDMAAHDRMSHIGPDGQDLGKRLTAAGYSYRQAAENVGVGQASIGEVIEGWKKSPPNSRNMLLAGAKHIGFAYEYKPDTAHKTFWTLVVAAP